MNNCRDRQNLRKRNTAYLPTPLLFPLLKFVALIDLIIRSKAIQAFSELSMLRQIRRKKINGNALKIKKCSINVTLHLCSK